MTQKSPKVTLMYIVQAYIVAKVILTCNTLDTLIVTLTILHRSQLRILIYWLLFDKGWIHVVVMEALFSWMCR